MSLHASSASCRQWSKHAYFKPGTERIDVSSWPIIEGKPMSSWHTRLFGHQAPWQNDVPIREELFGIERLELHAMTLAAAQAVTTQPIAVQPLHRRLKENERVLLTAYRASAAELEQGRELTHAAEWFLDNYHLVETQIQEIRSSLPAAYYRQLPKLAEGPLAGYPRVFGIGFDPID
ncbi:hypothetical protein, partial [Aeromonas encheleia]